MKLQIKVGDSASVTETKVSQALGALTAKGFFGSFPVTSWTWDGRTWLTLEVPALDWYSEEFKDRHSGYIQGGVAGVLLWLGVDVV